MIKLIGSPSCTKCKVLKMQLDKESIEYEYSESQEDLDKAMIALIKEGSYMSMPIIEKNNKYYSGATLAKVNKLL